MKKIALQQALPLAILTFSSISMWSYGVVIDGTDEFLYGFPFIYKCRGFHTSLSSQYFMLELLVDFLFYLLLWLLITYAVNKIKVLLIPKLVLHFFWIGFLLSSFTVLWTHKLLDNRILWSRDFEVVIFDRGISILGNHPDSEKYSDQLTAWIENNN